MKNKVLRSCSLLVLTVLFLAVSAQAQTRGTYQADIPFDFMIGEEAYDAGEYKIILRRPIQSATVLAIRKEKGPDLLVTAVLRNGNTAKNKKTSLVFDRYGDLYVLNRLAAPGFGFSAPKPKGYVQVWTEKNRKIKPDTVSILLRR